MACKRSAVRARLAPPKNEKGRKTLPFFLFLKGLALQERNWRSPQEGVATSEYLEFSLLQFRRSVYEIWHFALVVSEVRY